MRNFLLTLLCITASVSATAQCTPFQGSDFEQWVTIRDTSIGGVPYTLETADTSTWIPITDIINLDISGTTYPIVNKSTNSYSGQYAMKMAVPANEEGVLIGMIPFNNNRPGKLSGYYKYNGSGGDSLNILVGSIKDSTTNVNVLPPTANWTAFSLPINYLNPPNYPDSIGIIFNLINNNTSPINAWIDGLCFGSLPSGIKENSINNEIEIYPNPVKNQLNVDAGNEKIKYFQIMDASGRIIKTSYEDTRSIDLTELSKGLYLIQFQTDNGIGSKKFIKE